MEYLVSPMATKEELETTHCPEYIQRFLTGDGDQYSKHNSMGYKYDLSIF